jgi:membrane fusion protein (multidrug efflux system)
MTRPIEEAFDMSSVRFRKVLAAFIAASALSLGVIACSTQAKGSSDSGKPAAVEPLSIQTATVEATPLERFLRVTGSLVADEQAEVSAETAGRIVATPVERGTRVAAGTLLVRISATETSAQLQEAEANASQIEARLGLHGGQPFNPETVPDVMNAKAALDLAQAEFDRIKALLDQKVVSQSEYDQRRTQVEAARQQHQSAKNAAEQSFRSLEAARARIALAQKGLDDTLVRAPFAGVVAERLVSAGDYVSKGTRVATVVRVDPLRVELTVPESSVSLVQIGQHVRITVDAYPGEEFDATVRFVSPALRSDQRALTVEAVSKNPDGRLKPGLFATAMIRQSNPTEGLLVPVTAIETVAGTSRVYVVKHGVVEERIVTTGEKVGDRIEITSGVTAGEIVAAEPRGRLTDGRAVAVQ